MFAFILLLGLMPLGAATADSHRTSTRTEISFTSTPIEILVPGEESVDDAGIYRFRGEVVRDQVAGDITGEAVITFNGDFIPSPNCDPNDIENCFEGEFSGWGTVVVTDENGTWEGNFVFGFAFFEGEEPFMFGKLILTGRGGNAGKSIVADIGFSEDEGDETAYFTGFMLTMAKPAFGVNMNAQLCFEESETAYGAFISSGAIESSGSASGWFFDAGSIWTHSYGLFGETTFTDDWGSITIQWIGMVQDHPESSVGWGNWVIVGGTGAYENVNGHGKVTGHAGEMLQCETFGFGVWLQYLGSVHFN